MNRKVLKAVSALLAVSVVLPFAACNKNKSDKRSGKKITSDTPWFECSSYTVNSPVDKAKELHILQQNVLGCDEKRLLIRTTGQYVQPDTGEMNTPWSGNEYDIEIVTVIDLETDKTIRTIDLREGLGTSDDIEKVTASNGKIKFYYTSTVETEPDNYVSTRYEKVLDADTGGVISVSETDHDVESVTSTYKLGSYFVEAESFYNEASETGGYYLRVTAPDGNTTTVDLKDDNHLISYMKFIGLENESTALIPAYTDSEKSIYKLDLKSLTIARADAKDYSWLLEDFHAREHVGSDGTVYRETKTGIYKLNFKAKKLEEFFNYSNCGVNRSELSGSDLVNINGNTFILTRFSGSFNSNSREEGIFEVFKLTKAEKNPHEGKTILELYTGSDYDYEFVGDAIAEFNGKNDKYFIEVTDRYDQAESGINPTATRDEAVMSQLNNDTKQGTQLAADIIDGNGPDILLGTASLYQLNSGKYLADLTPYIGTPDQSKYFTNIIDAFKSDGKLYNLPVTFSISGIQTKYGIEVASDTGFTINEYKKFLYRELNGKDVLSNEQKYYFLELFNAMRDKFIADGKADFTNPAFAELAGFVKDNVPEQPDTGTEITDDTLRGLGTMAKSCNSTFDYLNYIVDLGGAKRFLGIPSSDGRGPSVSAETSVAVSAHAVDIDACGEFVKIIMSEEIQTKAAMSGFVLNREAFRKASAADIEYTNSDKFYNSNSDLDYALKRVTFTDKNIDDLEKIISNCSYCASGDPEITVVLIEEMPAYFSGQKDLDSVIQIAQNRVQKILDERK